MGAGLRAVLAAALAWAACNGPARVGAALKPLMECSAWAKGSKLMTSTGG